MTKRTVDNSRLIDGEKLDQLPGDLTGEAGKSLIVNLTEDGYDFGTAGAPALGDLTDVDIDNPQNGEVITYNTLTGKWDNESLPGGGDMLKSVYDPTNVSGDAFDMDNMSEGIVNKILNSTERNKLDNVPTDTNAELGNKQDILAEGPFVDGDKTNLDNQSGTNTGDETAGTIKTKYESNANTNAFTDAEKTEIGTIGDKADKLTITKVSASVNPAVANTHYLVDASAGNVTITLPDVTAGDNSIYQVTLSADTNNCIITTVGGTQLIGTETSIINHTVGGSLFFAGNGVDGYDITGDSRTYYRNIDLTGAGTTDLSIAGYESGSIYHCLGMASGETRTIIIPDDPSTFNGFWFKAILDGEGTVVVRTLSNNLINGNTEIDIVNDGGGVEISSFGDHYGIVQDSRPKVQNVSLTFYSLGEASTIVDPDVGFAFYNQSCNSIDDVRFDQVTATTRQVSGITGTDFYGGGIIGDEGVIGGLLPEGPVTSTGNFRKVSGADFTYYVEYYKYELGGTETLLATSTSSQEITSTTAAGYDVVATLPETTFGSTDRLLRKIYLNKVGGGSNPTVEFSSEGPIPSFSQVSIGASSITHNSLGGLQGGVSGEYFHLTTLFHSALTSGLLDASALHNHNSLYKSLTTTINTQTGTTYTLVLTDQSKLVTLSNAAAITLTIPTNASVAFPIGTQIDLSQDGAGAITVAGAGVTINSLDGNLTSNGQYVGLTLIKVGTDEWNLYGNLTT